MTLGTLRMRSLIWRQEPSPSLQALTGGSISATNPAHFDADHHSHGSDMAMGTDMLHALLPACPDMQESEKPVMFMACWAKVFSFTPHGCD